MLSSDVRSKSLDCVEDEQHFMTLCEPNACGGFLRECFAYRKQIFSQLPPRRFNTVVVRMFLGFKCSSASAGISRMLFMLSQQGSTAYRMEGLRCTLDQWLQMVVPVRQCPARQSC